MDEIVNHLEQASAALAALAEAQLPGANTNEEFARQVDAEYSRIAANLTNLAVHLIDLSTNPRPAPETYSATL
jgi:hypothetical protein